MSRVTQRTVALNGRDVVACVAIAMTCSGCKHPKQAEAFIASVWADWRNGSEEQKGVTDGVACFFDLYFAFMGDFERIVSLALSAIPAGMREHAEEAARELSQSNLRGIEQLGSTPISEFQVLTVPTAPLSQEAN